MTPELTSELINEVLRQQESILLEQLGDLVTHGLLVCQSGPPQIIRESDPYGGGGVYKFKLVQSVKFVLRDAEYIAKLEAENKEMKDIIQRLRGLL
jgi:hypothetical protein